MPDRDFRALTDEQWTDIHELYDKCLKLDLDVSNKSEEIAHALQLLIGECRRYRGATNASYIAGFNDGYECAIEDNLRLENVD